MDIREVLAKYNLTQSALARQVGVTRAAINRVVRGAPVSLKLDAGIRDAVSKIVVQRQTLATRTTTLAEAEGLVIPEIVSQAAADTQALLTNPCDFVEISGGHVVVDEKAAADD